MTPSQDIRRTKYGDDSVTSMKLPGIIPFGAGLVAGIVVHAWMRALSKEGEQTRYSEDDY